MSFELPQVPAAHQHFIEHLSRNDSAQLRDLVKPYNEYEAKLREGFAQHREHPAIQDPLVNAVPVFNGHEGVPKIRARNPDEDPESLEEFKNNFKIFSEQSLDDLDWSNVVAAGSSVVTAMLPVLDEYKVSKRALREYYHEKLAPSSDVDLFIWGLDEQAAVEKIAKIESCVRNCILAETTTIRTKNAITIVSQYPTRHIQIVLRLYKSVSEILTGFDVDCSCFAFDGTQVYATPRGITSFCSQTNTIDLSRRSPSYESRLAKYARRGFDIFYADFDRKRIDPTVYERSLVRTLGLARLLILERLPTESDRESYMNQRRKERGRPPLDSSRNSRNQLPGNIKDQDPQDVAEWVVEDEVSNYHTFTIPYGPYYNAKKIEKLLYVKDMLLNAEWNHKKDRTVSLHRHPCFIGDVESIVHDCCDSCPEPKSDEELKVSEEESKIYVQGEIEFMKDDPGRQAIGSFNPLTADDWTDMAYLGNTQELCMFITAGDIDGIKRWRSVEKNDVNHRDHTGRMPLHLAVMSGQLDIVKVLIDNGARITSRVQDGFTSLHMAASIGRADIIKVLAEKSEENEEMEDQKEDARKKERALQQPEGADSPMKDVTSDPESDADSDVEMIDESDANTDSENSEDALTEGSYIKVNKEEEALEDDPYGPDFFDMNVLAWDTPVSPLHVAILGGHREAIETLVSSFGADILLPIKHKSSRGSVNTAILNLVLASRLPSKQAAEIIKSLVGLGAKPSQSDMNQVSAAHGAVILENVAALKAMADSDLPSTQAGLNHMVNVGYTYTPRYRTALVTAIFKEDEELVSALLELGVKPSFTFEDFREARLREAKEEHISWDHKELMATYNTEIKQPIIHAARSPTPGIVLALLDAGADVNTLNLSAGMLLNDESARSTPKTVLDYVRAEIATCKSTRAGRKPEKPEVRKMPELQPDKKYLEGLAPGSYRHTMVSRDIELAKLAAAAIQKECDENNKRNNTQIDRRQEELEEARIKELEELEQELVKRGAKEFYELYSNLKKKENEEKPKDNRQGSAENDEFDMKQYYISEYYNDKRLDGEKEKAYTSLFEAAWKGDANTVKSLTLHERDDGEEGKLPPLLISTTDSWGLNVFTIAVVKNNLTLAQIILDITAAQYVPEGSQKAPKRRFRIRGAEDASDYDEDEEQYGGNDILLTSELVDDDFTIEDLGALSASAGTETTPADLIVASTPLWAVQKPINVCASDIHRGESKVWEPSFYWRRWSSPSTAFSSVVDDFWVKSDLLSFALDSQNVDLIKFMLRVAKEAMISAFDEGNGTSEHDDSWHNQLSDHLSRYISQGKWDLVELLITETGAGMPISKIFGSIAIPEEEREKPKYYQGLKIRGTHKSDWAAEAGGEQQRAQATPWRENTTSPFINAVYDGDCSVVDFWQGDACVRMYDTFGTRNTHAKSIKRIEKEYGTWKKAVTTWLGLRKHLAVHCAVLRGKQWGEHDKAVERVQHMLECVPNSLTKKSNGGFDPLWLAFYYHQVETAKLLIDAGAEQTTRNNDGENILHALLFRGPQSNTEEEPDRTQKNLDKIEALLKMVDKRLLANLFTDRSSTGPTGLTPLASYINRGGRSIELLQLIHRYMPSEGYTMFDGSGQTPTHHLVIDGNNQRSRELLEELARLHPRVLMQDNAMGQLPIELAWTLYLRHQTREAPSMHYRYFDLNTGRKEPKKAVQDRPSFLGVNDSTIATYRVLRALTEKAKETGDVSQRYMISVKDAREVARRLSSRTTGGDSRSTEWDEVTQWH
ncbi:unnamed protein product [Clonostachys chloroleuca]|uniref:Ankyrin repeat protein n=1 Tax=Clonostachys chloroleuca TaxID=1926264 RepID=A0AA35MF05_9HYPO|nr:unnamed protein product [Clonostachys chloroleuca]